MSYPPITPPSITVGNHKFFNVETFKVENTSIYKECHGFNSLIIETIGEDIGLNIRGRTEDGTTRTLSFVDEKRFLNSWIITRGGRYFVDLSGFVEVHVWNRDEKDFVANCMLSTLPCPEPLDVPIRYKRITPADGIVLGQFRAIEPLTDIQLSTNISYATAYSNEPSASRTAGFSNDDIRLAGQPLYGPFDKVEITQGVALLVLG